VGPVFERSCALRLLYMLAYQKTKRPFPFRFSQCYCRLQQLQQQQLLLQFPCAAGRFWKLRRWAGVDAMEEDESGVEVLEGWPPPLPLPRRCWAASSWPSSAAPPRRAPGSPPTTKPSAVIPSLQLPRRVPVLYALLCFCSVRLFVGVGSCWQTQLGPSWGCLF
jgi:hypothetical protein